MTDVAGSFGALAMNLHNQPAALATVEVVLEFAVSPHYDSASAMLMHRRHPQTIAATDRGTDLPRLDPTNQKALLCALAWATGGKAAAYPFMQPEIPPQGPQPPSLRVVD